MSKIIQEFLEVSEDCAIHISHCPEDEEFNYSVYFHNFKRGQFIQIDKNTLPAALAQLSNYFGIKTQFDQLNYEKLFRFLTHPRDTSRVGVMWIKGRRPVPFPTQSLREMLNKQSEILHYIQKFEIEYSLRKIST